MNFRSLLLLNVFIILFLSARSAWFSNQPVQVVQPDGSIVRCFASGDEYYNWLHDKEGFTIIQSADGYYYYGFVSGNIIKASSWKVNETDPSSVGLEKWAKISGKEYEKRKQLFNSSPGMTALTPHSGALNNLVVFIRFSDDSEFVDDRQFFDSKFNTQPGISLKSYYDEVSYNQLLIDATYYPACLMNSNLSYQDTHPRSYFQPYNTTTNQNGYVDNNDRTLREHALLRDAINWINIHSPVPSNLNIDIDADGFVDNVSFIIRGSNTGWSSLLWSHSWSLFSYNVFINGKLVSRYTFQPETQTDVGTICHEMFHSLGAPDLYHYVNTSLQPVQSWDLMDQGFGHMGAYMKWKYSNHTWIDSIPLITSSGTYYLNPLASPAGNCYKVISPYTNSDFYVLEYRQQAGLYESNLPGTGLLVYRITPLYTGNSYGPPDEVYIYRPDGTNSMNGNPSSACFSSQTGRISIKDTTNPSGFLENGLPGGLMISDISYADSIISFTITISNTSAPTGFTATATNTSQIELGWIKDQDSDHVLLAYSLKPMACNPEMEVAYNIGDTIPGGGIVIYEGAASNFVQSGLNPSTRYY